MRSSLAYPTLFPVGFDLPIVDQLYHNANNGHNQPADTHYGPGLILQNWFSTAVIIVSVTVLASTSM